MYQKIGVNWKKVSEIKAIWAFFLCFDVTPEATKNNLLSMPWGNLKSFGF